MGRPRKYLTEEERKAAKREYNAKYRQANKEKIAAQQAEYYQANKEKKIAYRAKYYQDNKERILEHQNEYYQDNKERILEYQKEYNQKNKEKRLEYQTKWYQAHPDYNNEYNIKYQKTPIGRAKHLITRYRGADKEKNRGECTITGDWIVENIFSKSCHYCGESDWTKMGCDRIDNALPHTPDNVVPCCTECNKKRGKTPYDEFMKLIGKVTGN